MSEPRTPRQTLETYIIRGGDVPLGPTWQEAMDALDVIEAEARATDSLCQAQYAKGRADALREAAERVRAFRIYPFKEAPYGDEPHEVVFRSAVLAILDPEAALRSPDTETADRP